MNIICSADNLSRRKTVENVISYYILKMCVTQYVDDESGENPWTIMNSPSFNKETKQRVYHDFI